MLKTVLNLMHNIFLDYSGFFDKQNFQNNCIVLHYKMYSLSLLINWMHPCWIKVLIFVNKNVILTTPNFHFNSNLKTTEASGSSLEKMQE